MTGPEHYKAAERLLAGAMLTDDDVEAGYESNLQAAQVHATLALAAATAEAGVRHHLSGLDVDRQWAGVISS